MKKIWLLLVPLLAACAPYYGPRGFWGPRERDFFEALVGFLFLILFVLLIAVVVVWVLRQGLWPRLKAAIPPPLAPRIRALREATGSLPPDRRERLNDMITEVWEALERGDRKSAEAGVLRAEAFLEFSRKE
ncbi:MAG: hypothetical protein KatS3mg071_0010 [Meiothermus sp.]|nr:MAG: hypothetical protein KatS3mg071_0010 [Meiothermus sp.]